MNSKLSTPNKPNTTTFSQVFSPEKIDNFLGKSKLNFWTKNKDLEQCDYDLVKYFQKFTFAFSVSQKPNFNCKDGLYETKIWTKE